MRVFYTFVPPLTILLLSLLLILPAQAAEPSLRVTSTDGRKARVIVRVPKRAAQKNRKVALFHSQEGSRFERLLSKAARRRRVVMRFQPSQEGVHFFRARMGKKRWSQVDSIFLQTAAPSPLESAVAETKVESTPLEVPLPGRAVECPDGIEAKVVSLTNTARSAAGLEPLRSDDQKLFAAARLHSTWMADTGEFTHDGWYEAVRAAEVEGRYFAQNIAKWIKHPGVLVDAWLQSPGHARNILSDRISRVAVSCIVDESGVYLWSQNFAD